MKTRYKILLWILAIGLLWLFYTNILFPAKLSVMSACNEEYFDEVYTPQGYYTAGSVSQNVSTGEIEVYISDETDIPLIMHERCHVKQYNANRVASCEYPNLRILNEVECYSIESFFDLFY